MTSLINYSFEAEHTYGIMLVRAVWRSQNFQGGLHEHEYGFGSDLLVHADGPLSEEFTSMFLGAVQEQQQPLFVVSTVITLLEQEGAVFLNSAGEPLHVTRDDLTVEGRQIVDVISRQHGSEATFITEVILP